MSLRYAIPAIVEKFDFEKVSKVMGFLNWTWRGEGVPTVYQLQGEAIHQLNLAVDEFEKRGCPATGMVVSSGGFVASVETFEKAPPKLKLLFYVDSASN